MTTDLESIHTLSALAREIADEHKAVNDHAEKWLDCTVEFAKSLALIGNKLIEAKSRVGHGNWLQWCEKHLASMHHNTVARYMNFARLWPDLALRLAEISNSPALGNLDKSSAMRKVITNALCNGSVAPATQKPLYAVALAHFKSVRKAITKAGPLEQWPTDAVVEARNALAEAVAAAGGRVEWKD